MPILPQKTFRRDAIHRVYVIHRVSTIGVGVFNLVLKTR